MAEDNLSNHSQDQSEDMDGLQQIRAAYSAQSLGQELAQALARIQMLEQQLAAERQARVEQQRQLQQNDDILADATQQIASQVTQMQNVGQNGANQQDSHMEPANSTTAPVQLPVPSPAHVATPVSTAKLAQPKPFSGEKLDGSELESWIYQMNLYFLATRVPVEEQAVRAALNLEKDAAVWFQTQQWPLQLLTWDMLQNAMRQAYKPADHHQRARDSLEKCIQTGPVLSYTTAFRKCLLRCNDVSDAEALHRYVAGLKPECKRWVRMHSPNTLHQASQIAERYDSTYFPAKQQYQNNSGTNYGGKFKSPVRPFQGNGSRSSKGQNYRGNQPLQANQPPRQFSDAKNQPQGPKCYRCQGFGHLARDCATADTRSSRNNKGKANVAKAGYNEQQPEQQQRQVQPPQGN